MRGTSSSAVSLSGWPVSVDSSRASSSAWASMASASRSSSRPRSAAGVADQAGNARCGGLDRPVDVGGPGLGHLGQQRAVVRVAHLDGAAAERVDELARR